MKIKILVLAAVSAFLYASCGPNNNPDEEKGASDASHPVETSNAASEGKVAYKQNCAVCHGNDGAAGIGNAANLKISKLDSVAIISVIGKGKNAMPAFQSQLAPEEMARIASYVMGLRE